MSKWIFDEKATKTRYSKLKRYYDKHHLNAENFDCKYFAKCLKSQPKGVKMQYAGGTSGLSPYYDAQYKKKNVRVLVVGKEAGYMTSEQYGTSKNFDYRSNILLKRIYGGRNNHIQGTLITLQRIFQVDTNYIYASYALSNALRCAFQSAHNFHCRTAVKDTILMRKNCFQYLADEIKILEPTILITQGAWAIQDRLSFVQRLANALGTEIKPLRTLKVSQSREYGLYEFPNFMCITTHHPSRLAQWKANYAPHSLWPMIEQLRKMNYLPTFEQNASTEYEKLVRPTIDKMFDE